MEAEITSKLHRQKHEGRMNGYRKQLNGCTEKMALKRNFRWGKCLKYEVEPEEVIYKTAKLPKICTDPNADHTPIQQFFSGSHVLITGATGFMGKIIVEKLLVSCPTLEKLYLIIREKKGQTTETRFDNLFNEAVFARLRETVPDFRSKIIAISGDCAQLRLGLSDDDYDRLAKNVTTIIHGAATVRFDEKIRTATHINIRGVREILNFSRKCQNLKSLVHISTAYANCIPELSGIEERFYPAAYDYNKLIDLIENESEKKLEELTPTLISPWPNTYAFTKQIAEDVVLREGGGLPIAIYRPAMVLATAKEPIRSWSDNIYGPTGVIVGAGTGVLRVMHADPKMKANGVPVDMAVNGVIAAAWKAHMDFQNEKNRPVIYNYVSTYRNAITWDEFATWNALYGRKWATVLAVWYPIMFLIKYRALYLLLNFLVHTVPAHIADTVLFITGNERKLVKGYKKVAKFCDVVAYFATRDWTFPDDNVVKLWNSLTPQDKEIYPFDIAELDWDLYALTHLLGLRVHIAKDNIDTIEAGRLKYKRLLAQHIALLTLFCLLGFWLMSKLMAWFFL